MGVHCLPLRPKAAVRPSPISLFCTYGEISLLAKNYCTGAPVRNVTIISSFSMLGPLVWNMQASSSLNGFLYRPLYIHGSPLPPPLTKSCCTSVPLSLFCTYGEISLLAKNYCTGAPCRRPTLRWSVLKLPTIYLSIKRRE